MDDCRAAAQFWPSFPRSSPSFPRSSPSFPRSLPVILALSPRHSRALSPSFPRSPPVIPAKAGTQTARHPKSSTNSVIGSPLPLRERARVRARRALARRCGRDARAPRDANLPHISGNDGQKVGDSAITVHFILMPARPSQLGRVDISSRGCRSPKFRWRGWHTNAVHNPLDSRFRGNDGVKIGNSGAIIASSRLCAFAPLR